MTTTTAPTLDPDLAAVLDAHNVAPTVDALLAAFEAREWHYLKRMGNHPTYDLVDLARAFAVMVEAENPVGTSVGR
jgi:hypothetical protein